MLGSSTLSDVVKLSAFESFRVCANILRDLFSIKLLDFSHTSPSSPVSSISLFLLFPCNVPTSVNSVDNRYLVLPFLFSCCPRPISNRSIVTTGIKL